MALSLDLGSEMQLRGKSAAHGEIGHQIDPSWWIH